MKSKSTPPATDTSKLGLDLEPPESPRLRNQRRIEPIARMVMLFIGLQVLLLAAAGVGLKWSYDRYVAPRLNEVKTISESAHQMRSQDERRAVLQELRDQLSENLLTGDPTMADPLQLLDEMESIDPALSLPADGSLGSGAAQSAATAPLERLVEMDSASLADVMALRGRILTELLILKERNRLTGYADEAIVTGDRRAYELLWESLDNPDLSHLRHAARAEILRVKFFYNSDERILAFNIPVELFTDDPEVRNERDLSAEQLRELLANDTLDWRIRVRAAFLLAQFPEVETGDALVEAIMTDPHLAVVKESVFALGQFTGYRGDVLEFEQARDFWEEAKRAADDGAPAIRDEVPAAAIPVDPSDLPEVPADDAGEGDAGDDGAPGGNGEDDPNADGGA